jgi:acyl dehydratase
MRETLSAMPRLGALYASAAPRALRRVREVSPDRLPRREAFVEGVRCRPEQLVAYQRLMGDTVRDELPSVLMHGLGFPLALWLLSRPDFPLPLLGLVHLRNEVRHLRPVRPDEVLSVSASAEELRAHHAGTTVTVRTRLFVGEEPVWEGLSLYLAKGVRLAGSEVPPAPRREPLLPPATTARWRLDASTGRRFAAVLGDYNPIHLSALSAKALGFKAPIAHGMYLAGRALAQCAPHGRGYAWEIEFATPVFLPGTVDVNRSSGPGGVVRFSGWNQRSLKPHFAGAVSRL